MDERRNERRVWGALLLSLGVHAVLLLWAAFGASPRMHELRRSPPIEVQIVVVEPKPPAPPAAAAPAAPPEKKRRVVPSPVTTLAPAPAPAQVSEVGPTEVKKTGPSADAPRPVVLQPSLGVVLPNLGQGERELSKGHTIVNGPGEEPDAVAMREYTEESIKRRLDDDLGNGAAAARARSGLLDPYFTRMGADLNSGLGNAKVQLRERGLGEVLREDVLGTWQDVAGRYGKDGNPLGSAEEERKVMETGLGRMVEGNSQALGDIGFQRESAKALQQFGAMEAFIASAQRARLRTVIELRQDASGALAEAVFLERSGDEKFDEFVLHQARKVVREKGEVEDGEPPYKDGWRSVWQFTWEPPKVKAKLLRVLRGQPAHPLLVPRP